MTQVLLLPFLQAAEVVATEPWYEVAGEIIALITAFLGLVGTGIGAYLTIKAFIEKNKDADAARIWEFIKNAAKAAIAEAERSGKEGAEKKEMVINMVDEACKAVGIDIHDFLEQLNAFIDQCVDFANKFQGK